MLWVRWLVLFPALGVAARVCRVAGPVRPALVWAKLPAAQVPEDWLARVGWAAAQARPAWAVRSGPAEQREPELVQAPKVQALAA